MIYKKVHFILSLNNFRETYHSLRNRSQNMKKRFYFEPDKDALNKELIVIYEILPTIKVTATYVENKGFSLTTAINNTISVFYSYRAHTYFFY